MRDYEDMIKLPHHVSAIHPHMSLKDRAAQFSPFAALTGYGDEVNEAGRVTETRIEPDEDLKAELSRKLALLSSQEHKGENAEFVYFCCDKLKEGGAYVSVRGTIKKVDVLEGLVLLSDGTKLPIADIIAIHNY